LALKEVISVTINSANTIFITVLLTEAISRQASLSCLVLVKDQQLVFQRRISIHTLACDSDIKLIQWLTNC